MWSYIYEGQLCIESRILCITARCYVYLLWSEVNYTNSESLESKESQPERVTSETVQQVEGVTPVLCSVRIMCGNKSTE